MRLCMPALLPGYVCVHVSGRTKFYVYVYVSVYDTYIHPFIHTCIYIHSVGGDVTLPQTVEKMFSAAKETFGTVTTFVHNAGDYYDTYIHTYIHTYIYLVWNRYSIRTQCR